MTIVIIQRITAMMPMPVCASLGRAGDRERGHRKGCNRSQDYDCLLHHRFSKTALSQANGIDQRHSFKPRLSRSPSAQLDVTGWRPGRQAISRRVSPGCAAVGNRPARDRTEVKPSQYFLKIAYILPNQESLPLLAFSPKHFHDFD